jgi:hypothetical protein
METQGILSHLAGVRKTGGGWQARCPAHEDRQASLSISTGDDGRLLLHCHAGCTVEAVVGKLGLTMRDLMPSGNGSGKHAGSSKPEIVATYDYRDEQGDLLYQVVRYDPKDFRQRKPKPGGGWEWKIGNVRRVLYRLPQLLAAVLTAIVFIVEGEKDVDNLVKRGLVATCNAGGADSGKGEKWLRDFAQFFRGRRVAILPDKDGPGRKHAQWVLSTLQGTAAEIKVVELPGDGKDATDWLDAGGTVEELLRLVEAAPIARSSTRTRTPAPQWRPYPIKALPEPIRTYIRRGAAAIGVDPSYLATALLATLAGTIGNSRLILLKRGWTEPAVLWCVLVGDSGTLKSPAIDAATKHVRQRQAMAIEAHRQAMEQYERDLDQYKADLDSWRHYGKKKGDPPPETPVNPVCERIFCSDVTVEGLAVLLADNWRGLLLVRDELAGWVGSFDQYKSGGRGGSDTAHWLTIYGARDLLVDRKGTERRTIYVRRAAVSIVGGIQPGTLVRVFGQRHFEDGLAARLLLAMPPRQPKQWTEAEIDEALDQRIGRLFDRLYEIEPARDANDQPEPVVVGMSAAGKAAWIEFYNAHAQRQADATGEQAAALSKIEGAAARLALVLHCVREAAGDRTVSSSLDDQDVSSGVALALWYADEAERVYSVLQETDDGKLRRQVVELISRNGGRTTANDLRRRSRHFADSDAAEKFLDELVKAGVGTWEEVPTTDDGGRPTRYFRLSNSVSVSETPENSQKTGVSETNTGETGVVGWQEFDQFGGAVDGDSLPVVSETPPKPEENEVSDTDTTETAGNEEFEEFTL